MFKNGHFIPPLDININIMPTPEYKNISQVYVNCHSRTRPTAKKTSDKNGRRDRMSMRQLAGVFSTVPTQLQPVRVSDRAAEVLRRTSCFLWERMAMGTHQVLWGSQLGLELNRWILRNCPLTSSYVRALKKVVRLIRRLITDDSPKNTTYRNHLFLLTGFTIKKLRRTSAKKERTFQGTNGQVFGSGKPRFTVRWILRKVRNPSGIHEADHTTDCFEVQFWWKPSIIRSDRIWQIRRRVAVTLLLAGFGRSCLVAVVNISISSRVGTGSHNNLLSLIMLCPLLSKIYPHISNFAQNCFQIIWEWEGGISTPSY